MILLHTETLEQKEPLRKRKKLVVASCVVGGTAIAIALLYIAFGILWGLLFPHAWRINDISSEQVEAVERILRFDLLESEEIDMMIAYNGREGTVRIFVTGIEDVFEFLDRFEGNAERINIPHNQEYKKRYGYILESHIVTRTWHELPAEGLPRHRYARLYIDFAEQNGIKTAFLWQSGAERELLRMIMDNGNVIRGRR